MIKGILFLAIACMIFVAGQRKSNNIIQQNLKSNLIRFHVRANSNSRMDQTYKLKVRDAVIDQISPELSEAKTKEEAFKILKMQKNRIKNTAQEILKNLTYLLIFHSKQWLVLLHDLFGYQHFGELKDNFH